MTEGEKNGKTSSEVLQRRKIHLYEILAKEKELMEICNLSQNKLDDLKEMRKFFYFKF